MIAGVFLNAGNATLPVKSLVGTDFYASTNATLSYFPGTKAFKAKFETSSLSSTNANQGGYMLGSGDAPESEESYCLESPYLDTTLVSSNAVIQASMYDADSNTLSQTMLISVTNVSDETQHIAEVGLRGCCYGSVTPDTSGNRGCGFLLDRTVLDSPVDIPPNGSATIEYVLTIDLN